MEKTLLWDFALQEGFVYFKTLVDELFLFVEVLDLLLDGLTGVEMFGRALGLFAAGSGESGGGESVRGGTFGKRFISRWSQMHKIYCKLNRENVINNLLISNGRNKEINKICRCDR